MTAHSQRRMRLFNLRKSCAPPKPAGVHGRCWLLIRLFTLSYLSPGCCSPPSPGPFTPPCPVCLYQFHIYQTYGSAYLSCDGLLKSSVFSWSLHSVAIVTESQSPLTCCDRRSVIRLHETTLGTREPLTLAGFFQAGKCQIE